MDRIASDTGGTFTDLVAANGRVVKVPSTPHDPAEAVRDGIAALLARSRDEAPEGAAPARGSPAVLAHGTTVATNALLERRGARVALVTNEGFADVIEIARQDRPSLYDPRVDRPEPVIPRRWRYEVRGRLDATGAELTPVDVSSIPALDPEIEAVAVCLLHADLNPAHEQAVARELRRRGYDVTASHEISPEMREYERTVTTAVNAYLRPRCRAYLHALAGCASSVLAMTSAGGLVPAPDAAEQPARLLLSGPAGGVLAGAAFAAANGFGDAITFDMGGTSTDVCLVLGGRPAPAAEREVAGFPVRLPSLDVHTIGAGGGSIAHLDDGGALVVGPRSAGAVPGPACYGGGGTEPTVTDADLVLGRIPADHPLPGLGVLDAGAARAALERAGATAEGVVAVVDANMEQALRRVSVEQGIDPRGLALVAFGGAGPLHACALADALGMHAIVVPPRAGVCSAVGILCAPIQVDLVETWPTPRDHTGVDVALDALGRRATELVVAPPGWSAGGPAGSADVAVGVTVARWLDCRYEGQSHDLRVPSVDAFAAEHERHNGYARPGTPVEVTALRASASLAPALDVTDLPAPARGVTIGPAVVAEDDCTIYVAPGWRADPGAAGTLVLRRAEAVR